MIVVRFASPDGRLWSAIGGGATPAEAVAFARDSLPADTTWEPVGWEHLHGS